MSDSYATVITANRELTGSRLRSLLFGLLALVCGSMFAAQSLADQDRSYRQDFNKSHRATVTRQHKARGGSMLSMNDAIAIAKQRSRGEVLSARRSINSAGETVYVIKILTRKGVVRTVRIPAHH